MPAFLDDVVFPVHVSKGSTGGPDWLVQIVELASGREERNTPWSAPLRRYDARWGVRSKDELYEILKLYHVAAGPLRGFRLLDWTDWRSGSPAQPPTALDQPLGTGDGATVAFDLWKRYEIGAHAFTRRIHKPFGTALVAADAVPLDGGFTLDAETGRIVFAAPPAPGAALTWGGQFHVPVRFDGHLDQTTLRGEFGDIPSIPLRELRL